MSTLTDSSREFAAAETKAAKSARPGFWRRFYDGMVASQQRRAEREIAAYLNSHGGLLTDDMEREIMRRVTGGPRKPF